MRHDSVSTSPFGHLDCQENPYDLRPMVRQIMEAENWLLDRLPPDRPLVIIMGEHHDSQGHKLLQKAVLMAHEEMSGQSKAGKFAFGYENYHDYVHRFTGKRIDDPNGCEAVKTHRTYFMGDIHKAKQDLLDYCVDKNISVGFNDVSCTGQKIDYTDPFTREIVSKHYPELLKKTPPDRSSNRRGHAISNLCIVEKALEHMQRTQARVYIQQCGQAHVFGCKELGYPIEESLSKRFKERGAEILPVICNYEIAEEYIPDEAQEFLERSVILSHNEIAPGIIPFDPVRRGIGIQSELNL